MLAGEVVHQIDAKSRMRMPTLFKDEFDKKYAFRLVREGVLAVYPAKTLEERFAFMKQASMFDVELQDYIAEYMSAFTIVEEDLQGRIMIPKSLRTQAKLGKDIVTYGAADHVNITSVENREKDKANVDKQAMMRKLDEMFKNHV